MGNMDFKRVNQTFREFCTKYMLESFTLIAIILGAISAWLDLFVGGLGWATLFLVIGSGLGLVIPRKMDKIVKTIYSFSSGKNQTIKLIAQGLKLAIALFLPFVYFCFLGVMAGTAYDYYIHDARVENKDNKAA